MRAREYRPVFDSLDSRLLLSDTSGGLSPNLAVVTVAPSGLSTFNGITNPTYLISDPWLLPGTPPDDPYDPTTPTQGGVD